MNKVATGSVESSSPLVSVVSLERARRIQQHCRPQSGVFSAGNALYYLNQIRPE